MKKAIGKIIILGMALIICLGVFAGCTPSGFIKNGSGDEEPLIYNGDKSNANRGLIDQFPELNSQDVFLETNSYFFLHDDIIHSVEIETHTFGYSGIKCFTVYKIDQALKIITIADEWNKGTEKWAQLGLFYLYDSRLYYSIRRNMQKRYFNDWRNSFSRHEFFYFDLNSNENKETNLQRYAEVLRSIDNNWEINPNYKVKK